MISELSEQPQSKLDQWFTSLGFNRGNPFATTEADRERAMLPEFFVDVEGYEHIKGDQTTIVFAPRGGGKSALRVVLASQAAPISSESDILAIEYTDFDALVSKCVNEYSLTIDDHLSKLMRAAVGALLNTLCGDPASETTEGLSTDDIKRWTSRATILSPPERSKFARLIRNYDPGLLSSESLYKRIMFLNSEFSPDWNEFIHLKNEKSLYKLIEHDDLNNNKSIKLLVDLNDYPDIPGESSITPTEQMASLTDLTHATGFRTIRFLVDRLDENRETADNPELQAKILEPLLAHLPLLEFPGVAFKFFLPRETRDVLIDRPTIRRDRLTDQAVTVEWNRAQLKNLLNERLAYYSGEKYQDLVQLCPQETRCDLGQGRSVLLGEWIEGQMLNVAQGSPRRLLVAGQLLFQAHVERCRSSNFLEREDWEVAKRGLMHKMPPVLRIHWNERVAFVGDRKVKLSKQKYQILQTLISHNGQCKRESLIEEVWGTKQGVTDAAVDQAISRLRNDLGDDPDSPVYLITERGSGFKLKNYEID